MEPAVLLPMLRRWWWLLIVSTILGGALAYGVSTRLTPTYEATTTLLVVQTPSEGVVQLNDLQTAERLANTFSRLITIRPVLEDAIEGGPLPFTVDELEERISVSNPITTQLLQVSARSSDPALTALMANTVADAFISSNQSNLTSRPGQVSVVESAEPPLDPIAPRRLVNTVLGATVLLLVVGGLVVLIEYLDDTVKSPEQASAVSGLPTLGRIEQFERLRSPREQLQSAHRPRSTVAEAYRATRTNLSYAIDLGRDRRLILVTSPGPGEGKTTTAGNLAVVFGLAGYRVCVVDTDLRRPTLHRLFALDNQEGLTNLLLAREPDLKRAVQRSAYTNVSVVTSGPLPPNPSELLGSARTQEVLERLKASFDVVLLDSPPALVVTDASVLATLADGLLVVTRARRTRVGSLRAMLTELAQSGRPIAGLVINRVPPRDASYRSYGGRPDGDDAERLERIDRQPGVERSRRAGVPTNRALVAPTPAEHGDGGEPRETTPTASTAAPVVGLPRR